MPSCAGLKDRNVHVFGGERSDFNRVIGLAWHRLTVYIQIAWRQLKQKVREEQLQLSDSRALMASQFGIEGRLWSLHEIALHVGKLTLVYS